MYLKLKLSYKYVGVKEKIFHLFTLRTVERRSHRPQTALALLITMIYT